VSLAKVADIQRINKQCKFFHKSLHTLLLERKIDIIKTSTCPNFNFPTKFQSS